MNNRAAYILMLFTVLFSAVKSVAQSNQPDVVCVGSTKNYYVIATSGSSYRWKVNGVSEASTSNSVDIKWTSPGVKTLTVQEITKDNCYGTIQSLQVTVNEPSYSKTIRKVCPLQLKTFTWNGISCTSAGTYRTILTNAIGCDSIAELELGVEDPLVTRLEQRICKSELPFKWNNQQISSSGTYYQKFVTPAGCDSIVYLKVEVPQLKSNTIRDTICMGESCEFVNKILYDPGTYIETLKDELGCDSVVTLHLAVETGKTTTQKIQLYTGELYTVNGKTYSESGTYTERLKVGAKCADELITELTFIDVPNTITPNGDGINDVFMSGHRVKIYNRNGVLLFEGNNGWDGTYKGNFVSKDTYFYVLFNEDPTIKPKEGYLTVLK